MIRSRRKGPTAQGSDPTYQGKMAGVVVDNQDPEQRGRVKVAIPDLYLDPTTGNVEPAWCEGGGSFGPGAGKFSIPPVGASVWVQPRYAEDNQIWQMIWEPGRHGAGEFPHPPNVARGVDDESCGPTKGVGQYPMVAGLPAPGDSDDFNIRESVELALPSTPNAGEYAENHVLKTPGGILVEVDDTPGAQRIHVWMPNGVYYEINAAGTQTEKFTQKISEVVNSETRFIGGDARSSVLGSEARRVQLNSVEDVRGRKVSRARRMNMQATQRMHLDSRGIFEVSSRGSGFYDHSNGREVVSGGTDTVSALSMDRVSATTWRLIAGVSASIASPGGLDVGLAPLVPGLPVAKAAAVQAAVAAVVAAIGTAATAASVEAGPAELAFTTFAAAMESMAADIVLPDSALGALFALSYAAALRAT